MNIARAYKLGRVNKDRSRVFVSGGSQLRIESALFVFDPLTAE